jgi:hypothetical protein
MSQILTISSEPAEPPKDGKLPLEYDDYLDLIEYVQDHIRHATTSSVFRSDGGRSCGVASLNSAIGRLTEARDALAGGLVLPPDFELTT